MRRDKLEGAPNKTRIALPWLKREKEEIIREVVNLPGVDTFLGLSDTPKSYVGAGTVPNSTVGKFVAVKTDETGLEFILGPLSSVTAWMGLGLVNIEMLVGPMFQNTSLISKDDTLLANPSFQNTDLLSRDITTLANPTVVDLSAA